MGPHVILITQIYMEGEGYWERQWGRLGALGQNILPRHSEEYSLFWSEHDDHTEQSLRKEYSDYADWKNSEHQRDKPSLAMS